MKNQTRLKSDLVIAFGFSKSNADEAIRRYFNQQLNIHEIDAIEHLEEKDPFQLGKKELIFSNKRISILEHLNYKITLGK